MKKSIVLAALALIGLGGCVAVPVYDGGYGYDAYYAPPAASISFGYVYHDHGRRHRGHHGPRHWRGHRH